VLEELRRKMEAEFHQLEGGSGDGDSAEPATAGQAEGGVEETVEGDSDGS